MMRLFLLALALLCSNLSAADELPPIHALITHVSLEVSPDGITQQHTFKERWIRTGDTQWSERLIPLPVARAFHQLHDNAKTPHKHFMYQMAARWITRQPNGELDLTYVDHYHRNQVHYPPIEYGQAGFVPNWPQLSQLFDPALLSQFTLTGESGEHGSVWYQLEKDNQIMRVRWSDSLKLALEIEHHSRDGYKQYHMTVQLKPALPMQLPWQQLAGYDQKEISDFFD